MGSVTYVIFPTDIGRLSQQSPVTKSSNSLFSREDIRLSFLMRKTTVADGFGSF
jgi:hypothetical protein